LGGDRPSQTNRHTLSLKVGLQLRLEDKNFKDGISFFVSILASANTSLTTIYATHKIFTFNIKL